MVLLTITVSPGESLDEVAARLGIETDQIDQTFGLIEIDPDQHLAAIRVTPAAAAAIQGTPEVCGPFSDPQIAPFGPPEGDE